MNAGSFQRLALPLLLGAGFNPVFGCGACGCTLNSDWASQGFTTLPGFGLGLRQDYFNQDQLRTGTAAPGRSGFALPNAQEIQQETLNRNTTLNLDYVSGGDWGLNLQVPFFNRFHSTIAPGDTAVSTSRGAGLGDMRFTARYQGFQADPSFGIQAGLKLPTGAMGQAFAGGPEAGTPLDRGVQRGSGTTDLLAGVFKYGSLSPDWNYFAQVLAQIPLDSREGFRPGNGVNANAGLRYEGYAPVIPSLQVNVRAEQRESCLNADVQNSGATLVYLSPGVTIQASARMQIFAFFQAPVLQRVNGLQLELRSSVSIGFHCAF